jgi:parallel beta-helix repeat protein
MHLRPAYAVLAAVIVAMSSAAMVSHSPGAASSGTVHPTGSGMHPGGYAAGNPIPPPTRPFVHPSVYPVALTVIGPNGAVNNATAPITVDTATNTYTLTASFIGGILDERNGSTIVGNGKSIQIDTSLNVAFQVFQASSVNISDLTVTGTGEGFFLEGAAGVTISSSTSTATSYAVDAEYGGGIVVTHLNATLNNGVYGYDLAGFTVRNSNLSQTSDGVYAEEVSNLVVTNCTMFQSTDGVYSEYSDNTFVWGNNVSETSDALYFYEDQNVVADWNNGSLAQYFIEFEYGTGFTALHDSGSHNNEVVYIEYAQNVRIDSLNAPAPTGDAVYLEYVTNASLTHITISKCTGSYALYLYLVNEVTVSQFNASTFYEYGVYLDDSSAVTISSTNASFGTYAFSEGFYTYYSSKISVTNSSARGNEYGFEDYGSSNLTVTGNDFSHAKGNGEAVYFDEDNNIVLKNNNIFNASDYAVEIYYAEQFTMIGNNASWSGYYGFYSEYSNGVVVMHNTFDNAAEYGAYAYADSSVSIIDNSFGYLHYLYSYALELEDLSGAVIEGNSATHANYSAYIDDCSGVLYENNNDSNSYFGVYAEYNANLTIEGNQFVSDHQAFYIEWNGQTWFYHNNFANDIGWLNYASVESIAWNAGYPTGGNYWSNYTSPDTMSGAAQSTAGSDGIVDHPFTINASMHDMYPLTHAWVSHTATFTETGLSAGSKWSVTIGGSTWWSTTPSIVYTESNGANASDPYTVGHVAGYHAGTPPSGSITADGSSSSVHVAFTTFNYSVTFHSVGLKSGTSWSVSLNGATLTATTTDITTTASNGTWSYVPKSVTGYALTTAPGNITINGAAGTVTVDYVGANNSTNGKGNNGNSGTTTTTSTGYTATEFFGLLGALILALILAAVGFALWSRGRQPKQPAGAAPWTPPPAGPSPPMPPPGAPPAGGSPPPGAMGGP